MKRKKNKYEGLITQVREHVEMLFSIYWTNDLIYHDILHTTVVVKRALKIASDYNLDDEQLMILTTAAWFHDTGQLLVTPEVHEIRSCELMSVFLDDKNISSGLVKSIGQCIMATALSRQPAGTLDMILRDADTYNLGTRSFRLTDKLVKQELTLRNALPQGDWDLSTLRLLKNHRFYTPYCIQRLSQGKLENIAIVEKRLRSNQ